MRSLSNDTQAELESQPTESMGDNKYRVDVLVKFLLEKILDENGSPPIGGAL